MRVLVAGWFSFPGMGASAGDLLCRDLLCTWLAAHRVEIDVCAAPPFDLLPAVSGRPTLDWAEADPQRYEAVLFVCGPFGNGWPIPDFLARFAGCRLIGINLTMLQDLTEWNPFDLLIERDSSRRVRPDLVFLSPPAPTPVVGLVLVHPQTEYGERGRHAEANQALRNLARQRNAAVVPIDTRLDTNDNGFTSAAQVDSLIARMDVVLTTRLHGMVMAIRNGVPPVVVDPIAGGAKVLRQARAIRWPYAFAADALNTDTLLAAFDACLTSAARAEATACAAQARAELMTIDDDIIAALGTPVLQGGK